MSTRINPVRAVDAFVDELELSTLGFERATPAETGRPGYHPSVLLKLYLYGYLNRIASSRRLEREAQRNLEVVWLIGRLAPDFKTIADFRRDNGRAIRATCRQFVLLCREFGLFAERLVAIDGSKFKAVNTRDKNYTQSVIKRRMEQVEASISRYLAALDTADRHEPWRDLCESRALAGAVGKAACADAASSGAGSSGAGVAGRAGIAH
jgi:transposase